MKREEDRYGMKVRIADMIKVSKSRNNYTLVNIYMGYSDIEVFQPSGAASHNNYKIGLGIGINEQGN